MLQFIHIMEVDKMNEIETYLEQIKTFEEISPVKGIELLEQEGTIIYIGRKTCPYCRRFVNKLSKVAQARQYKIYLIDSESEKYDFEDIQSFREQFNIPTVPGFLVKQDSDVAVRCDSSMTEEEIVQMIEEK